MHITYFINNKRKVIKYKNKLPLKPSSQKTKKLQLKPERNKNKLQATNGAENRRPTPSLIQIFLPTWPPVVERSEHGPTYSSLAKATKRPSKPNYQRVEPLPLLFAHLLPSQNPPVAKTSSCCGTRACGLKKRNNLKQVSLLRTQSSRR